MTGCRPQTAPRRCPRNTPDPYSRGSVPRFRVGRGSGGRSINHRLEGQSLPRLGDRAPKGMGFTPRTGPDVYGHLAVSPKNRVKYALYHFNVTVMPTWGHKRHRKRGWAPPQTEGSQDDRPSSAPPPGNDPRPGQPGGRRVGLRLRRRPRAALASPATRAGAADLRHRGAFLGDADIAGRDRRVPRDRQGPAGCGVPGDRDVVEQRRGRVHRRSERYGHRRGQRLRDGHGRVSEPERDGNPGSRAGGRFAGGGIGGRADGRCGESVARACGRARDRCRRLARCRSRSRVHAGRGTRHGRSCGGCDRQRGSRADCVDARKDRGRADARGNRRRRIGDDPGAHGQPGPRGAGRALQRHGRPKLAQQRQVANGCAVGGVVRRGYRRLRACSADRSRRPAE